MAGDKSTKVISMKSLFILTSSAFWAIMIIWGINTFGGKLDGWLRPVAVAQQVEFVERNPNVTVIRGTMDKYRECQFIALEAFLTNPTGLRVQAPLEVGETLKLRPEGVHEWGPWSVNLPAWQAQTQLEIIVYHSCNPFFVTETVFLKSKFEISVQGHNEMIRKEF